MLGVELNLSSYLRYTQQQKEPIPADILLLKRCRDFEAKKSLQFQRKSSLKDFFLRLK